MVTTPSPFLGQLRMPSIVLKGLAHAHMPSKSTQPHLADEVFRFLFLKVASSENRMMKCKRPSNLKNHQWPLKHGHLKKEIGFNIDMSKNFPTVLTVVVNDIIPAFSLPGGYWQMIFPREVGIPHPLWNGPGG